MDSAQKFILPEDMKEIDPNVASKVKVEETGNLKETQFATKCDTVARTHAHTHTAHYYHGFQQTIKGSSIPTSCPVEGYDGESFNFSPDSFRTVLITEAAIYM